MAWLHTSDLGLKLSARILLPLLAALVPLHGMALLVDMNMQRH